MNKFDKYKRIVQALDILYTSQEMLEEGNRFNVVITSTHNFISFNCNELLYDDVVDKEIEYKEILELCKFRWEDYIYELTKFKTK